MGIKYHIQNNLTDCIKDSARFQNLSEEEHIRLYQEVKNATLQDLDDKLVTEVSTGVKRSNDVQSLLLWVLGITDEKPTRSLKIKSPGSMMDIDLDFSKKNREKLFEYLAGKYGEGKVAHVATFGTMAAKGAIRNSARAQGFPIDIGNRIVKFIPEVPGITIQDAIDVSTEFQSLILKDKDIKQVVDIARKLEGLPNSISVHASAFVISENNLDDDIPMMVASRKDQVIITQFEYKDVESNALLKFDILG